ncbi:MAG TPA: ABC transporter permease [Blastocatellia bacterium]|nr:ABC transporter permease [Blastocatellia bacterium]
MTDWRAYVRDHLPPLALGPARELEIVEEMAQHLEAAYEEALAEGASIPQAYERAAAHIKDWRLLECDLIRAKRPISRTWMSKRLAVEVRVQSEDRKFGGLNMGSLLQDLRYGMRTLLKSKGFTVVTVLSLALGIGANTAIFSLIDAVLLKTLPVRNPRELVLLNWLGGPNGMSRGMDGTRTADAATGLQTSTSFSYLTFTQLRDNNETLSDTFAFAPIEQLNVNVDGLAEVAGGQFVSGGYHDGLGVQALLGRTLTNGDDKPNADPVAVITNRYWQRRFGRDPGVIGKSVNVNNVAFTIIGVTPLEFLGALQVGEAADLSIPFSMEPIVRPGSTSLNEPWFWWVRIMGRLKPGVTEEQARNNLEGVFQQSALEGWNAAVAQAETRGRPLSGEPRDTPRLRIGSGSQGLNESRSTYSQPLMLLMVVVGLVLLIACANVANLLLARAALRTKEIAVRLAIGAGRWRLVRQLLTESMLLSLMGGVLGVFFAYWGKDTLLALRPWGGGELAIDPRLDLRVLGFTTAVSVITGILFGLAPALRATRVDLTPALKDSSRNVSGGSHSVIGKMLIVVQAGMSVMLLIGAGLFLRTLNNLEVVDVGFNRESLLLFRVDPKLSGYKGPQILSLYQRMIEHIQSVPGVRSATISRHPLLSGSRRSTTLSIPGYTPEGGRGEEVLVNVVAENFFDTMEMPLLLGRCLSERDDQQTPKVAVINQTMAQRYFGQDNPIGRTLSDGPTQIEIIGVVRDAKYTGFRQDTRPTIYTPYLQGSGEQMSFAVRTAGDPTLLAGPVRDAVRDVDQNLPMFDVRTQNQQAERSLAQERLFATLSSFFSVIALLLASIGLYGVMSHAAARRTNEIGIRMALGARAWHVTSLVVRETLVLVLVGTAVGLAAALAATGLITSMLFGLTQHDPPTISFAVLLMISAAALAAYLPARRASRVDPLIALRYE